MPECLEGVFVLLIAIVVLYFLERLETFCSFAGQHASSWIKRSSTEFDMQCYMLQGPTARAYK